MQDIQTMDWKALRDQICNSEDREETNKLLFEFGKKIFEIDLFETTGLGDFMKKTILNYLRLDPGFINCVKDAYNDKEEAELVIFKQFLEAFIAQSDDKDIFRKQRLSVIDELKRHFTEQEIQKLKEKYKPLSF